jgi:hypothetical protein
LIQTRLSEPRSAYWRSGEEEYCAKGSLFPRFLWEKNRGTFPRPRPRSGQRILKSL